MTVLRWMTVFARLRCWALAVSLFGGGGAELFAHSSDFVFARWSQDSADGAVELSLSIQISDNPNVESREQAAEVLTHLMKVRSGEDGDWLSLGDIARATFEDGRVFPQDSPVPISGAGLEDLESGLESDEETTGERAPQHEILTLKWKWTPAPDELRLSFSLPDDCQQNVVFWWADAQGELASTSAAPPPSPGKEVPWQIMLGGDESFPVMLGKPGAQQSESAEGTGKKSLRFKILSVFVLAIVAAAGLVVVGRAKTKAKRLNEQ